MNLDQAYAYCTALARSHYENFPVGRLVPRHLQRHVHAIYAFARQADDLADEGYGSEGEAGTLTREQRLAALNEFEYHLLEPETPLTPAVFIALHHTIRELDLPVKLFTDLLSAFRQDVVQIRYRNFPDVLDYCRRSANPIGRLVLLLHGERDPYLHGLSDAICTGLQLANFWQDVAVDLQKDRIYLPQDDMCLFGVTEDDLFAHRATTEFRELLRFQVDRTWELFNRGEELSGHLHGGLRWEIRVTWLGGTTILKKIEDQHYNTLDSRPKLRKFDVLPLLAQAWLSR